MKGSAASSSQDTLFRILELLRFIQDSHHPLATSTLALKLREQGHQFSDRTLQRDLERLSKNGLVECHDEGRPYRWASPYRKAKQTYPSASTTDALAFVLAAPYLKRRLPAEVFQKLTPRILEAEKQLDQLQTNRLANWHKKVRSLPGGRPLRTAQQTEQIWQQVSEAVLAEQQLMICYRAHNAEPTERIVNPLAVVVRETKSYLIATVGEHTKPALFAINRINKAEQTHRPAQVPPDFDLTELINSGRFGWAAKGKVQLKAHIREGVAAKLQETPISDDQSITAINEGWHLLEAEVPDDRETLWWIFSMNHNIQVLEPEHWVEEITHTLQSWADLYAKKTGTPKSLNPLSETIV